MHSISLAYSLDGTNWSTSVAFSCLEFLYDMNPEIETEGSSARRMGTGAEKCVKVTPRMQGSFKLAWSNFDTSVTSTPSANDKMKALQYWLSAPNRQIYFQHGSKHIPGAWTDFDASNNTAYVNVTSHDYEYRRFVSNTSNANGKKLVAVTIEFEKRSSQTLYKWDGTSFV
jgi:hypothetical protein